MSAKDVVELAQIRASSKGQIGVDDILTPEVRKPLVVNCPAVENEGIGASGISDGVT